MSGGWLPDGHGLDERSRELLDEHGGTVHLRLSDPDGVRYPQTACGAGLGQWWTGATDEVTCPGCLLLLGTTGNPAS